MRKRNIAVLLLTALLLTGLTGCVQRGDTSGVEETPCSIFSILPRLMVRKRPWTI